MMVRCLKCEKAFNVKPAAIKRGQGKYCSRTCGSAARSSRGIAKCQSCGILFSISLKRLRNTKFGYNFCSKNCFGVFYSGENHPLWKNGKNAYLKWMREKRPSMCLRCGISNKAVLVVHHLDENRENNRQGNLVWLCRNCHFIIHNYKEEILVGVA